MIHYDGENERFINIVCNYKRLQHCCCSGAVANLHLIWISGVFCAVELKLQYLKCENFFIMKTGYAWNLGCFFRQWRRAVGLVWKFCFNNNEANNLIFVMVVSQNHPCAPVSKGAGSREFHCRALKGLCLLLNFMFRCSQISLSQMQMNFHVCETEMSYCVSLLLCYL